MKTFYLHLLIILTLSSCITTNVEKRYSSATSAEIATSDIDKYVTVDIISSSTETKPQQHKGIFDLSDHGQQAYIGSLTEILKATTPDKDKEKLPATLLSSLIKPIEKEPESNIELTKFSRKLVFSIKNMKPAVPASRIDSIRLTLELTNPDKVKFSGWTQIVTVDKMVDIGKLTLGKTSSFSLSPTVTTTGAASTTVGSASYGTTRSEEIPIKDRFLLSGTLGDERIIIFEKGVPNSDLSGDIAVDIEFQATKVGQKPIFSFDKLRQEKDGVKDVLIECADEKKVKVSRKPVYYPELQGDIKGDLTYDFVFRDVINLEGQKTLPESDDIVVYANGVGKNIDQVLVKKGSYSLKTWNIYNGKDFLHITDARGAELLNLASADDMMELLEWLKIKRCTKIGGNPLKVGPARDLTNSDIDGLHPQMLINGKLPE